MTSPTLSNHFESAIDELDMAHNTMFIALDDARAIGLAPFRIAQLEAAMSDTKHAIRDLNDLVHALKLARPTQP